MIKIKSIKDKVRVNIRRKIKLIKNRKEKDNKIQSTLLNLKEVKQANLIHCYKSLKDEVSTDNIITSLKNKVVIAQQENNILKKINADIFIIPGRAFDLSGNRLGRGFGCYDIFLKNVKGRKIALAYEQQLTKIPAEKHDEKVDIIITEKRIIQFNKSKN